MTDDLRARLEADQRIIDAATDGPWEVGRTFSDESTYFGTERDPDDHAEPGVLLGETGFKDDAVFIAASRTRWEQANQALLAVLELHKQVVQVVYSDGSVAYECDHCPDEWPCPTVKAIQKAMSDD